jgi:16S rRNA (cytosine967-C5)-methyltransferase
MPPESSPQAPSPRLNPGRRAALRVLLALESGGHAEDLLAQAAPIGRDRPLAWHIVMGVLRNRGALDTLLAPFSARPYPRLDPIVRNALRMGAFEIHLSRTPLHAAVSEAVEATRALGAPQAAGMVNAILRKAATATLPSDPFLNLPSWLARRLGAQSKWVSRLSEPAPLSGVLRDPGAPLPTFASGPAFAAGQPIPGSFQAPLGEGLVENLEGFTEGAWWIMDPSAAKVADIAYEAAGTPQPRVLDACAAPGGKSLRLASRGARVFSVDLQDSRLDRLRDSARRVGFAIETRQHDWLSGALPAISAPFDVVLVDAPCTGLGTIRRHPEIRWQRLDSDPSAMSLRQRKILESAACHVAPGGALVYAVCSPLPEEGHRVVANFPGFRLESSWSASPPQGDEDAHQAFLLRSTAIS